MHALSAPSARRRRQAESPRRREIDDVIEAARTSTRVGRVAPPCRSRSSHAARAATASAIAERAPRGARQRALHPRPRGRGVRAEFAAYLGARTASASPTAPTRSRSRCARWASARATRSSCRRSRSTRAPRRSRRPARAGLLRRRPRDVLRHAETVEAALTPRTKAVVAVHLFGNVAPVAEIEALGVPVLEDAAQAPARRAATAAPGALGTIATFSFFPSKNLGAFGDGGAITTTTTSSPSACGCCASTARATRSPSSEVGYNSRLDELQAAILRVLLPHLDGWADGRRAAARALRGGGLGELVALPAPTPGAEPAWHLYVVRHERADERSRALARGHRRARATTACPCTCSRRWRPSRRRRAAGHRRGRAHAPRDPDEPVLSAEQVARSRGGARARLGRPDQQPARARHAAGDRARCAPTGTRSR
jgi:hypothetical protein